MRQTKNFLDTQVSTPVKLATLWASLMSCFIYCDYFGLYTKGAVLEMNDGIMGPLGVATPLVMLAVSAMMAIPSLMIAGSVILKASTSRGLNLIVPPFYILIMIATSIGAEPFYMFFAVVEVLLLIAITFHAWKWPSEIMVNSQ